MRILWIPQVSCLSSEGKLLLSKDSNITFVRKMLKTSLFTENEVLICFEYDDEEIKRLMEEFISINKNISFVNKRHRSFKGAFLERFNFDIDMMVEVNNKFKPDIVFANEPTKALPMKYIFRDSKIVSYIHWLAADNMKFLMHRQIEGIEASDICYVNSKYVVERLKESGIKADKVKVFYPPSGEEIYDLKHFGENGIIYNHRLSSDAYYLKAFNDLLEVLEYVENEVGTDNMPKVYFTNPSGKAIDIECRKPYFVKQEFCSTEGYKSFLKSKKVGLHVNSFFDSKGMWCSSTTDCGVYGIPCLLPKKFGYKEIFADGYYGYCESKDEMKTKLLEYVKNPEIIYENSKNIKSDMELISPDKVCEKISEELKGLIKC